MPDAKQSDPAPPATSQTRPPHLPQTVRIAHISDVRQARRAAGEMAAAIGFTPAVCEELVLVTSELAANLIKHAGSGVMTISALIDGQRKGIQIESQDQGPGIRDIDQALADGFSTGGGLGYGLGSVNRLMDDLKLDSRYPDGGTRVLCHRWQAQRPSNITSPLEIGTATRAHPGMKLNGDGYVVKTRPSHTLAAVIDGLGHGQYAHRATQKARSYIERHSDLAPADIFRNVERECRATRGVVMALARFDYEPADEKATAADAATYRVHLTFAGIGNIEARVVNSPQRLRFITRRGILGKSAPKPITSEQVWPPGAILVMHSDGLSTNWKWERFRHLSRTAAARTARELLKALNKDSDDATVVVVKWKEDAHDPPP